MLLRGLPILALPRTLNVFLRGRTQSRDFFRRASRAVLHERDELDDLSGDDTHRLCAPMIELTRGDGFIGRTNKAISADMRQLERELSEGIGGEAQFLDAIGSEIVKVIK